MNRQQRRAAERARAQEKRDALAALPTRAQKTTRRMMQHGILPDDLKKNYEKGIREGFNRASIHMVEAYYAATAYALNKEFGFGQARCIRALRAIEETLVEAITNDDLRKMALERVGIEIHFDDPVERAQAKGEGA